MILKDNTIVRDKKAIGAAHVFSSSVLTDEKCEFAVQFQNLDVYTGIGVADQELSTEKEYTGEIDAPKKICYFMSG